MEDNYIGRAEKILTGIICGDALGKMTSKCSREQVQSLYGGPVKDLGTPIIPKSKRLWQRGDITDDSILTLLIADSLIARGGFDRADIGTRLIRCPDPRGGRQIYKLKESGDPNFIAKDGITNGPAIRVAGISIVYFDNPLLYQNLIDSSTLTHFGRESVLGSLLVGHVYAEIMRGQDQEGIEENLLGVMNKLNQIYMPESYDSKIVKNLALGLDISKRFRLLDLCNALEQEIGMTDDPPSSLTSAVVIGLNYNLPRQCLIDLVNRNKAGADIDTTAAIAGAICGGLNGTDDIEDWKVLIEQKNKISTRDYATKLIGIRND